MAPNQVIWEEDPKYFIFNEAIPGKTKMYTKKLNMKDWVKIDESYPDQMKLRKELWKKHEDEIFVSNPDEKAQACKWELFELLYEYLPERFPDIFELRENCIYNKVLDESVSIDKNDPEDPLVRAGRLTQEDWVIIEWDEKEQGYVLTSGIVYFPMRWSLQEKFNKSIAAIHVPVKPFMEHLVHKVYDIFKKMQPQSPLWRANWAVFNDLEGPLDLFTPTGSLDRNDVNKVTEFEGDVTGKKLTFRAEYQTLRKLPKTKCIVFGIRTYQRYLEEFKDFPLSDCEGLIKAIDTLNPDFVVYKGAEFWKDAAMQYLQGIVDDRNKSKLPEKSWLLPVGLVLGAVATGFFVHKYRSG